VARIGDRREMEAFVRSVELGGFSAAARELKLSPSALSKLVSRLESALKVRLLNRTTRRLAPTPEGELFLARCRRILAELEDAESEVGRRRDQPRGKLRLHVGVGLATHLVVPALPKFLARYPEVEVELIVEDRTLDLTQEGIDISVRPGPPADASLVARKLGEFERVVCAAPAYLARHGEPRAPEELARHRCIGIILPGRSQWPFMTPSGRRVVQVTPILSANSNDTVLQLGLSGLGIIRLNDFVVAKDLRAGRLVPVLAPFHCGDKFAMYALYARDRHRLPRVAAMLDFLAESFTSPLAPSTRAAPSGRRAKARSA
jgi:DNA-binding transcriptional LysR family regulator